MRHLIMVYTVLIYRCPLGQKKKQKNKCIDSGNPTDPTFLGPTMLSDDLAHARENLNVQRCHKCRGVPVNSLTHWRTCLAHNCINKLRKYFINLVRVQQWRCLLSCFCQCSVILGTWDMFAYKRQTNCLCYFLTSQFTSSPLSEIFFLFYLCDFHRVATLMQKQNSLTFHWPFPDQIQFFTDQIQFFTDQITVLLPPICFLAADKWLSPFTSSLKCTSLILQMKQIKSLNSFLAQNVPK